MRFSIIALLRLTMAAINQMPAWIWGKMTPVLQITDTDVAHHLKRFANEAQHRLRRELRQKALAEGVHACFKQGIYEILRVTSEALAKLKAYMDVEAPRTLQAGLRNYLLSYRPDFQNNTLVKAIEQPWAKGFREGNHRIRAEWAEERYQWLDEKGIPSCLPFEDMGAGVRELGDMEEHSYHGPEGTKVSLKSWEGTEEEAAEEVSVNLDLELTGEEEVKQFMEAAAQLMDRVRGSKAATGGYYDMYLSTQAKREQKSTQKKKRDDQHRAANAENFAELQKRLQVASRRQVLESIVPQVGKDKVKSMSKSEVKSKLRSVLGKFSRGVLISKTRLRGKTAVADPTEADPPQPPPLERRVRVSVQVTGFKRLYGCEAIEKVRNEATGMSTIQCENVFHTREVPSNILTYSEEYRTKRELWNAKNKSRAEKQVVLEMANVVDPVRDSRIEAVTKDTPAQLSTAHIDVWCAVLEATFCGDERQYFIVRPDVSWMIAHLQTQNPLAISNEEADTLLRLLRFLGKVLLRYDKVLLPVRNVSVATGHFTLLTVLRDGLTYSWHYRDSLESFSQGNLETTEIVLDAVRRVLPADAVLKGPEVWPSRVNVAMQYGVECAAHVSHYLEEEVRESFKDAASHS